MRHSTQLRAYLSLAALLVLGAAGQAQSSKKVLTPDTYDSWLTIQGSSLSPDGRWAAYTLSPVVGDGEVVVRATEGATEYRAPRGWTGRPIMSVAASDSPFVAPPAQFTADSRWLVFLGYAPKADFDRARLEKKPFAQQPKGALNVVDLSSGGVTSVPRVRSFRLAKESGRFLFYLLEAVEAPHDSGAARTPAADAAQPPARKRDYGSPLVVRDLQNGSEQRIADVVSFAVDDSARWLAYAVSSRSGDGDGAYLRTLATAETLTLVAGEGNYRQFAFDRAGAQIAFVSDRDEIRSPTPRYALYYATTHSPRASVVAAPGVLDSMSPSDKGHVEFARDGSALLFGVAPLPRDTIPADSLADKAVFDLWHYRDARLQPQQRLEATRDRDRTFSAVFLPHARKLLRLASDSIPSTLVSDDGRVVLAVTPAPYLIESMWGAGGSDIYVIDVATGRATRIAQRVQFDAQMSPDGKFVVWFDHGHWNSYAVATAKTVDLTTRLAGVHFEDAQWDTPDDPAPYGTGGCARDDRSLLLYDEYDIWDVDPSGTRAPRLVTDSVGTRQHLVLRVVDLDPDVRYIDPAQPLVLHAFNDNTKASGFYRVRLDGAAPPELIVMADRNFGALRKARHADRYLVTQQTVSQFPDLWTGPSLAALTRISDANPQQAGYKWPTVELVKWLSSDGVPLKGLLYKPDDFDPSKQYPMIVYYYERLSDNLHSYNAPAGRNVINPTVYTSLGYLVFFPDIVYETGWPGPSAVKCIIPGVQSIVSRGFVNPKAIGLAGQSWGGYQTAYLITQTSMFAAAVPNAPVANMTSAYGGIRWGSGLARSFQYEKTQSRIGGSIWEYPVRYIENSPLFHLDRVTTPVFFMQNDADDAVPWYQGIELFVGLRRLGKEVYFISYNGDVHNPRKRANQKDIDRRMQQFFATKLKGEPAPDWMVRGIPFLDKGRDQLVPVKAATASVPNPGHP